MIRIVRLSVLLIIAWVVMTTTHELGHVIGGWIGGATLTKLNLAPWSLPYSLHHPDPHPLVTLWSGPVIGVLIPMMVAGLVRSQATWLIADFCLLANGVYLSLAWISGERFLDTSRLLDAGAHPLSITVFCAITISFGYVRFRQDCIDILTVDANPDQTDGTS